MTIERLHIKSMKQFSEVNITFNPRFNFITGPNGCGKTSILSAVAHCLHWNGEYSQFKEDSEFWIDITERERKFRFGLNPGFLRAIAYRKNQLKTFILPPVEANRESFHVHDACKNIHLPPLVIGAQRKISYKNINGLTKESGRDVNKEIYCRNSLSLLYNESSREIKQWIINRYFIIDKDWAGEERLNWEHLTSSLQEIGPFNSNFRYIRTGRDLEPVFSLYEKECYLEELSSGFQAMLYIIIAIFEWVEGCLPEGERNVKTAFGTVLIDELDNHLHPEWQLTVRQGIAALFPNLQFIVTTHSPHLLASAKENEIIMLPSSYPEERYDISPSDKAYSGWSTDLILTELMGVRSLDNKDYEKLVAECYQRIRKNDLEGLKAVYKKLEAISHPGDDILIVLKVRMAGMEAKSDD